MNAAELLCRRHRRKRMTVKFDDAKINQLLCNIKNKCGAATRGGVKWAISWKNSALRAVRR